MQGSILKSRKTHKINPLHCIQTCNIKEMGRRDKDERVAKPLASQLIFHLTQNTANEIMKSITSGNDFTKHTPFLTFCIFISNPTLMTRKGT